MKCHICHEHEATVRVVLAAQGKKYVLDICGHCMQEYKEQMMEVGMEKVVESLLANAVPALEEEDEEMPEEGFGTMLEGLIRSVLVQADALKKAEESETMIHERTPRKAVEVSQRVALYARLKAAIEVEDYEGAKALQEALLAMDHA